MGASSSLPAGWKEMRMDRLSEAELLGHKRRGCPNGARKLQPFVSILFAMLDLLDPYFRLH